jgi:hypothetical protein
MRELAEEYVCTTRIEVKSAGQSGACSLRHQRVGPAILTQQDLLQFKQQIYLGMIPSMMICFVSNVVSLVTAA